jgi:hypothetical protein
MSYEAQNVADTCRWYIWALIFCPESIVNHIANTLETLYKVGYLLFRILWLEFLNIQSQVLIRKETGTYRHFARFWLYSETARYLCNLVHIL